MSKCYHIDLHYVHKLVDTLNNLAKSYFHDLPQFLLITIHIEFQTLDNRCVNSVSG